MEQRPSIINIFLLMIILTSLRSAKCANGNGSSNGNGSLSPSIVFDDSATSNISPELYRRLLSECFKSNNSLPLLKDSFDFECFPLHSSTPCKATNEWFVLVQSPENEIPMSSCSINPCFLSKEKLMLPFHGKCFLYGSSEPCSGRGMELHGDVFGNGVCECKDEFIMIQRSNGSLECLQEFERGPCHEGENLVFFEGSPSCKNVSCDSSFGSLIECQNDVRQLIAVPSYCPLGEVDDGFGSCVSKASNRDVKYISNKYNVKEYLCAQFPNRFDHC